MTNEQLMLKKLDLVAKLLALQVAPDEGLIDRVKILSSIGMDGGLIAEVLDIERAKVTKLLYESKRKVPKANRK